MDTALAVPDVPASMPQKAAQAAVPSAAPYVLTVFLRDDSLPVISIEASAPDRAGATGLADAAVAVLGSEASPGGHFTSLIVTGGQGFRLQAFVVDQVSPVRVKLVSSIALPVKAIGASFFVFLVWCAGALLLPRLSRRVRARGRALPA